MEHTETFSHLLHPQAASTHLPQISQDLCPDVITLSPANSIYVTDIDMLTSSSPFYHMDRVSEFNVMILVLSGCLYVSENNSDYEINPGELLFLKEGTHQFGKKLIQTGTSWIYVHFKEKTCNDPEYLSEYLSEYSYSLPKKLSDISSTDITRRLMNLVKYSQSNSQYNNDAKNKAKIKQKYANEFYNMKLSSEFTLLLLDIYELTKLTVPSNLPAQIKTYLDANLTQALSSQDLENYFHLSYKYMASIFRQENNTSIMTYFSTQKILSAARELRSSTKSITSIGEEYGYSDSLYFSKCFKKVTGQSPREYRKLQSIF